ncbi:hypothetical protein GCM10027174_31480 [Salinifilum aidingensis]
MSCLADGADPQFARAVLDRGGSPVAIVPAAEYRDGLPAEHHTTYDASFEQAADVVRLDHIESTEQSRMDASERMLDMADELIAVWEVRAHTCARPSTGRAVSCALASCGWKGCRAFPGCGVPCAGPRRA